MKKTWIVILFVFLVNSRLTAQTDSVKINWLQKARATNENSSEDYFVDVVRKDPRPFLLTKLRSANNLRDFVDGFPSEWLGDNIKVELTATEKGKSRMATSVGEKLTPEQKVILNSCNLYSTIQVSVKYQAENVVTHKKENRNMEIKGTAFPDAEAVFIGGESKLRNYLRTQIDSQISDKEYLPSVRLLMGFTINESGNAVDVKIVKSSGNEKTDKLIIGILRTMPVWTPAIEKNGNKVKQDFVFNLGNGGC